MGDFTYKSVKIHMLGNKVKNCPILHRGGSSKAKSTQYASLKQCCETFLAKYAFIISLLHGGIFPIY